VEAGKLPGFKVGSKWRFRKSTIDKWIENDASKEKTTFKSTSKIITKPARGERRVVITGIGIVSPIGIGKENFWKNCLSGVSGVKKITSFDVSEYNTKIAALIEDFIPERYMEKNVIRRSDRFAQFAIAAASMAIEDSGIKKVNPKHTGVYIGSGLGGMFFCETQIVEIMKRGPAACNPISIPKIMPNSVTNQIAILYNAQGPNITISTACSSSAHSIGQAFDAIRRRRADVIIAGGTESPISQYNFLGFDAMGVMSKNNASPQQASRPFDKNRDGFVMGEGAAILILESLEHAQKRNANIYAEIKSYSVTSGAYHIVTPRPDARDIARAMHICIEEAKITPPEIDYINAHGTSTIANDLTETKAIKKIFGEDAYKISISSTKSMVGHTLGAAGAIETAVCALSIKTGEIHPTINLENRDPECDLDYISNKCRKKNIKYALSNSFAFGNNNACLLFAKHE
jgi:3-oxoacyl-[acyl-carrier-protein] synthase II